jgi:hypothetical protein
MKYEQAMSQASVGFRVARKGWVNKNVTTSDGNDFKPIVTEASPATDSTARRVNLETMTDMQLQNSAKHANVVYAASDSREQLIAKIVAATPHEAVEPKVSDYSVTDEDKAADDWVVIQ